MADVIVIIESVAIRHSQPGKNSAGCDPSKVALDFNRPGRQIPAGLL